MKLYDYVTGELMTFTEEFLAFVTDEFVMDHFIPDTPSSRALYTVIRAEQDMGYSGAMIPSVGNARILTAIRLVVLTALPGEMK